MAMLAVLATGCASMGAGPDIARPAVATPIPTGTALAAPAALAPAAAPAAPAAPSFTESRGPTGAARASEQATTDTPAAAPGGPRAPANAAVATVFPIAALPSDGALPIEPTTIGGSAPDIHADLWARIRAGFAMPELASPLVAEKERFYLSKPDYLQRMFARGGRYLFFIVEEIEKRGMPTELALLPFVESAMNPIALSPAQAAGLWQFIPSTGRAYDLRQDWWVDNRRDVVQSTRAALDYLQRIYAMHGNDWFLALASYNWGEGAVGRAVRRNQAAGRPADYLNLTMPNETRHYVPKLMALKNLVQNAERLGVALPALPNRPYFVAIEKTRPIDRDLAARFAGLSIDEFAALNPAHNRPVISATRNNQIKLPADRVERFRAELERHEAESKAFATWEPYTLKQGESLDDLARMRGVSVAELRKANGLREGSRIMPGTQLLAPQAGARVDEERIERFVAPRIYEQVERPARYHTVGKRESLASIASRYKVPVATLAAWNGLRDTAPRGARLLVQQGGTQTLLTTEDGERSVVPQARPQVAAAAATAAAAPTRPAASTPGKAAARAAPRAESGRAAATPASARKAASSRDAARSRPAHRPDTVTRVRMASRT